MKRNENLYPLSWEHHSGLVYARKIKRKTESKDKLSDIKNFVLAEWNQSLNRHFKQEEEVIGEIFRKYVSQSDELSQMESDHNEMRLMISQIIEDKLSYDGYVLFSEKLTTHIRFEENILFPLFEKHIPEAELNEIGNRLKEK